MTDVKIALSVVACAFALVAQFYPAKFPDNKLVIIVCAAVYALPPSLCSLNAV
jgi:hypothetical protein